MNIEELRDYCLAKIDVTEGFPFGDDPLVFKVGGKMFALVNLSGDMRLSLKCDPERAVELRERYSFVIPGYHLNKKSWNTIELNSGISPDILKEWIDHSYDLVFDSLPKKIKEKIKSGNG